MKESAHAGLSYIRSQAKLLKIDPEIFQENEIHVHVPEGGIPKDGPSAGVSMVSALLSAITERPLRGDLSMTGEITLQGDVLPIGGINEKVMAAQRAGIKVILLPAANMPNWEERPKGVGRGIKVYFVDTIDDVWKYAFASPAKKEKRKSK